MKILYWIGCICMITLSIFIGSAVGAIFGLFLGPAKVLEFLSDNQQSDSI